MYVGGIRFCQPLPIGSIVEVEARLLMTDGPYMHVGVHVRSGDPRNEERTLCVHCLIVFAMVDENGSHVPAPT